MNIFKALNKYCQIVFCKGYSNLYFTDGILQSLSQFAFIGMGYFVF